MPRRARASGPDETDVIVIGGGPGGSTVGASLARSGLRVLLLERERFPRDHIGESLLPASMPLLDEIGALPAIERAGFLKKWGATMVWGSDSEPWAWFFRETNRRWPHSYQVSRPEFDQLLLENARDQGADVREGHQVVEVLFEGDRARGVRYRSDQGPEGIVHADFVVDASGQNAMLGRARGLRSWDPFFRNLAVYGYFAGARRLHGEQERNNILVESFPRGWSWAIPLHTGVASVGVVLDSEHAQRDMHGRDLREFFVERLQESPHTWDLVRDAELQPGISVIKDWSYSSEEVVGDGWILVGDAACFVDPLFSSGVHLAMSSAMLAAAYIRAMRHDPALGKAAAPVYKELYYTQYSHFHQMAKLFYASNRTPDSYFWEARRVLGSQEGYSPRHAFINAVAGQPPQGYERVVIEHGEAPEEFASSVQTLEGERAERKACAAGMGAAIADTVPVLAPGVQVSVKPVLEGSDFVWGYVIESEPRPGGIPCSPLVAELVKRFDGRRSHREAVADLRSTFGPDIDDRVDELATEALRLLYVDGTVESLALDGGALPA
ncbi:MAG: FAD-dependent oxidoreductase [Dehalococcoidia bacterium]|nr:FAD-dependent oxidoreductase [Dehalococcoidia bacterium]